MKRSIIPLLVSMLLLCLCCQTGCAEQPPAVSADGVSFSTAQLQRDLDATLDSARMLGVSLDQAAREKAAQEVVDAYVIRALTEARLAELGLHDPDANTTYELRNAAQQQYDAYWQSFRDRDEAASLSDKDVTRYLTEHGVTIDYFYEVTLASYDEQRLLAQYGTMVEVSEADIDAFFAENYVDPARERYAQNVPLFEEEVLYAEGSSAYVPEGYRLLLQIVLPVPEDIRAELDAIEREAEDVAAKAQEAFDQTAILAMDGQDVTESTAVYRAMKERMGELSVTYGQTWQSVLAATREQSDELYTRMSLGESFEDLMRLFDPGDSLIYHRDSILWPADLKDAADRLLAVGDVSQPVLCTDGVHLLYYKDDLPGGAATMEAEERDAVRQLITEQRTLDVLKELTDPWKDRYHLQVDMSGLVY